MTKPTKIVLIVLGVVLAIPAVLLLGLILFFWAESTPSKILNFHPSTFQAKAQSHFFYSIGNDLKYNDTIDASAPTILHGTIGQFLVSPDATMMALVVNGNLDVIRTDGVLLRQIGSVDSIYREPKPLGHQFVRDDDFQWSRDSKQLYFIKDEFYESKGSQLFSIKGELWVLNISSGALALVIKPFHSYTYFFGPGETIYFSAPTPVGDLKLSSFNGHEVADVSDSDIPTISSQNPFSSFASYDMEGILRRRGGGFRVDSQDESETFHLGSRTYLQFSQGNGIKGHFYCSDVTPSIFLPGDQYFILDTRNCENAHGQLLIDTATGQYQVIPETTRVYVTLNTNTYPSYRITSGGLSIN